MNVSIAESALSCYQDVQRDCATIKKERDRQFQAKPITQRISYYACEALRWGGLAVAAFSFGIGTFFSTSFYLYGAIGSVAFIVGVLARSYFETLSPLEQNLATSIDQLAFSKEGVPAAGALKVARELYIDDIARSSKPNKKREISIQFFGKDNSSQFRQLYATSLLLESIQHIAKKNFSQAKICAKAAEKVDIDPPMLQYKMNSLAEKLQLTDVQERVHRAISAQKIFKLSDLDTVYNIAKDTL